MTEKKGSRALMVCVKETATFPRLMFGERVAHGVHHGQGQDSKELKKESAESIQKAEGKYTSVSAQRRPGCS